jgi:hypothetical protein
MTRKVVYTGGFYLGAIARSEPSRPLLSLLLPLLEDTVAGLPTGLLCSFHNDLNPEWELVRNPMDPLSAYGARL